MERYRVLSSIVVYTLFQKVAYHGVPEKAYEVFVDALQSAFLRQGGNIPALEDHNPAGIYIHTQSTHTLLLLQYQIPR